MTDPLSPDTLRRMDAYWRAANYLSVGQIYLLDNALLREPLRLEDVKPRLLGHWGTTPGLNFIYTHLNRAIKERDLDLIHITGPGHGGPGAVACAYLEGTYSEVYPQVSQDAEGIAALFKQFSFPGGIPSHSLPGPPQAPGAPTMGPTLRPSCTRTGRPIAVKVSSASRQRSATTHNSSAGSTPGAHGSGALQEMT